MNARDELVKHIANRDVKYIKVVYQKSYDESCTFTGTLPEVLPLMDFEYYNGFGSQEIDGVIWYTDGTWSERVEYDGSEWWVHKECPKLPEGAEDKC